MSDFKSELSKMIPIYCNELDEIDVSAYGDLKFSEEFEKRMSKLIRARKKIYYPLIKTTGRKIVSIIVAAALLGTMTVAAYEPARDAVKDFFIRIFSGYSVVTPSVESNTADSHKDKIEKQYMIDIPDGFELAEDESILTDDYISMCYYTVDKSEYLYFLQCTKKSYVSFFDNDKTVLEYKNDKYGNEIMIYTYKDIDTYFIFDNSEYIFELSGSFSEDELFEIYYSIK